MYNNYVLTHVQVWCRLTERWSSCKRSWRRAKRSRATACRADSRLSRSWRTNTWRRRRRGEYASACSKTSRWLTALDLSPTLKSVFSQFSADWETVKKGQHTDVPEVTPIWCRVSFPFSFFSTVSVPFQFPDTCSRYGSTSLRVAAESECSNPVCRGRESWTLLHPAVGCFQATKK